jgi:Sulfotransferase family
MELPPTVAPDWRPRSEVWLRRAPSRFEGAPSRPLFIGACPRSGTTLLRVMLDNHPDLAIPRETNFVRPLWWQRARFGDLRDPGNRRRVAEWIFTEKGPRGARLRDGRVSRQDAIGRVAGAAPTVGSIVQACLQLYAEVHGKPRWGDKRPAYSGFIGMLLAMFPDAQYVNLVRDPRGAVASQVQMGWDPPELAVAAATARWEAAIRRTDHFARRLRPDQLLDLRYEDMVSDPRAALERVCAFAGLRAGDAIETMLGRSRRGSFADPHARVGEPVTTGSVERWRERLSPEQIALVEHATAPLLERFGYRTADDVRAAPTQRDERELARQRRLSRREWRGSQRGELLRRLVYRRPVAAQGRERSAVLRAAQA